MKRKECEKCRNIALLKDSGESSAEEENFFGRHLAACRPCREEAASPGKLPPLHDIEVSRDILSGIKACSSEVIAGKSRVFSRKFLLKPALTLFAAAAAVFLVFFFRPAAIDRDLSLTAEDYIILDEKILSAENSLQAISLEFSSEFYDF